jgi:hypothetical protein
MGRGKLVFKGQGNDKARNGKPKKPPSPINATGVPADAVAQAAPSVSLAAVTAAPPASKTPSAAESRTSAESPKILLGTGLITLSGTIVTGHKTRFLREVNVGDALLVKHQGAAGNGPSEEMRVVTMRVSDTSLNLSSPFSEPVSNMQFYYIPKPRNAAHETRLENKKRMREAKDEEAKASGLYGTTDEFIYREKTQHGSYRIQHIKLDTSATGGEALSRGELLDMRTKKKSDKYC